MRPPPFPSASVRARAISLLTPCTHAQPQPRTRLLSCFPPRHHRRCPCLPRASCVFAACADLRRDTGELRGELSACEHLGFLVVRPAHTPVRARYVAGDNGVVRVPVGTRHRAALVHARAQVHRGLTPCAHETARPPSAGCHQAHCLFAQCCRICHARRAVHLRALTAVYVPRICYSVCLCEHRRARIQRVVVAVPHQGFRHVGLRKPDPPAFGARRCRLRLHHRSLARCHRRLCAESNVRTAARLTHTCGSAMPPCVPSVACAAHPRGQGTFLRRARSAMRCHQPTCGAMPPTCLLIPPPPLHARVLRATGAC